MAGQAPHDDQTGSDEFANAVNFAVECDSGDCLRAL
jgi:hypothetical protein